MSEEGISCVPNAHNMQELLGRLRNLIQIAMFYKVIFYIVSLYAYNHCGL